MGICGEGAIASLSGSANSSTPQTIADFRPRANGQNGPDGAPCNTYTITNPETSNWFNVYIPGLNSLAHPAPVAPGGERNFQIGLNSNDITLVQGWASTVAGATTSTSTLAGSVMIRRA